ncbi:MAG: 2-oxoglutarate ferredoxin oxidoreductase subunit alpha, partial [Bacteroidia bacterium]|nr:2-oxoglutarate ferredoxin oxidoreductase subunit alpha [Bacteroidia bacterium]
HYITENLQNKVYQPYERQDDLSRFHAVPGTPGMEHRIGGLEKENITGNISYDPANHELMVKVRAAKVENVANFIPLQTFENGNTQSKSLIIGWGSTYGSITTAVRELRDEGIDIAQIHIQYLSPFPKNLGEIIQSFDQVFVAELNNGQLIKVLRDKYLINAIGINKIQGQPFQIMEIKEIVKQNIN